VENFISLPNFSRDEIGALWAVFMLTTLLAAFLLLRKIELRIYARLMQEHPGAWDLYGKPRAIGRGNNWFGLLAIRTTGEHRRLNDPELTRRIYVYRAASVLCFLWMLMLVSLTLLLVHYYPKPQPISEMERDAIAVPLYP
jgi:hypothetical protein